MLDRMVVGTVAEKHHIVVEQDGRMLHEECFTRAGFDGPYSILYHRERPHLATLVGPTPHGWSAPVAADPEHPARRHYQSQNMERRGGAPVDARVPMLFNDDITISVAFPDQADPVYVTNGDADEMLFIYEGSGVLRTPFGDLRFEALDYVCIPKGCIHRLIPDEGVTQWWLSMECPGGVGLLSKWRNPVGQLRMDAPYSHRDFRRPEFKGEVDEGIRDLALKRDGRWHGYRYETSPLDVVGWDGTVYPWVFPILKFQARAGLVHLPPDWHGTFATRGALLCSFVPRAVDFHERAIPCPYPHSSVDCDEFLFYCKGNFTSRKGVGQGSMSHHPYGIPHGPHPGSYEGSVGERYTNELAVMVDTFKPMHRTAAAARVEDAGYHDSFL